MKLHQSIMKTYIWVFFLFFFNSCSSSQVVSPQPELSSYQLAVIDYFKEVALGFEFGSASKVTRKWNTGLKVYITGNPTPALISEFEKIITEINGLSSDGFQIYRVNEQAKSNFVIFFGSGDDYGNLYPSEAELTKTNWGLFNLYFDNSNYFNKGHMYVDIYRADPTAQRHLLREELTQSLGLAVDSKKYSDSIFQADWTTTTEYAQIDRDLIKLLYNPKMKVGLNSNQVDPILREILSEQ